VFLRLKDLAKGKAAPGGEEELRLAREEIAEKDRRLKDLRRRLRERNREVEELRSNASQDGARGVGPEDVVWIFCAGRSGSTWLAQMMADLPGNALWDEPLVGALFGEFYLNRGAEKRGAKFIMGPRHRDAWLRSVRYTVLEGAWARYEISEGGQLVIKEPHGSMGAPLLAEALPESGVVLLVRDPRDVMASALDAHREGSWISRVRNRKPTKPGQGGDPDTFVESDSDPDGFLRQKAEKCLRDVTKAKEAYDAHEGRKVLVKYEDLRADTLNVMRRIHSELGIEGDDAVLARVVEAHAWENVPEEEKGEGKFRRKAKPGGWREDLTEGQARIVEGVTAPLLDEFYPGWKNENGGDA
jgi:hypothetical protein